jgi:hypothetical protein
MGDKHEENQENCASTLKAIDDLLAGNGVIPSSCVVVVAVATEDGAMSAGLLVGREVRADITIMQDVIAELGKRIGCKTEAEIEAAGAQIVYTRRRREELT